LKPNEKLINDNSSEVIEMLPPLSYVNIYDELKKIFIKGEPFSIITNSFYALQNDNPINWGLISNDCKEFMKHILSPTEEIEQKIEFLYNFYNINSINNSFKVIHLRCGDNFLHNNIFDENLYKLYFDKVNDLVNKNQDIKFILLSDSSKIANKLKEDIPLINYWNNNKIHLGDLKNYADTSVFDTLVDFFIMSKSNEILVINESGFSKVVSIIYNIKYTNI
jgi:hypothetical protein